MKAFMVRRSTTHPGKINETPLNLEQVTFIGDTPDGPRYRITGNPDGTITIREVSQRSLTITPVSGNSITIGATES